MANSLRHLGRGTYLAEKKVGGEWILATGERFFDLSGGPFVQTLVSLESPPAQMFQNVSGPGGIDTSVRIQLENEILERTGANCGGILWATSGSDAIESALWAVTTSLSPPVNNGGITYIVREGSYHGNTDLTRWLSTRGRSSSSKTKGQAKRIVVGTEEASSATFTDFINHLEQENPVVVLLETIPTTGQVFWQGYEFYKRVLKCCHERHIPVVIDEVACGAYRHGWFSAFEWLTEFPPAAVAVAKGLTCGTYPLSCVLLRSDIASNMASMKRLPAYTFGLTDPAAWLALEALRVFDGLLENGGFDSRRALIASAVSSLYESGFQGRIESTDTTLRLAISDSSQAERISTELRIRGLTTYVNSTVLNGEPVTYVFCCPPLDLDHALCASLIDKFCAAILNAQ